MKAYPILLSAAYFFIGLFYPACIKAQENGHSPLRKTDIISSLNRVADWQLRHPTGASLTSWEYGTFYTGLMAYYKCTGQKKYLDSAMAMGNRTRWEPQPRPYDANTLVISQAFLELYKLTRDVRMIDKSRFIMDMTLARDLQAETTFDKNKYWYEWWTWCDALFMAPAAYAGLWNVTGNKKYLEYMDKMWWLTSDYLYSKTDSLFFRDDRFFNKLSVHGKKIFWSRGNGWVLSGLCNVMQNLPRQYPARKKYEAQFIEMCYKVASLQLAGGYWNPDLLDTESLPVRESSGTSFFCYAFAWGINNGLLPEDYFRPVLLKGWASLVSAIQQDGMLGYVQKVGDQPEKVTLHDTEAYGAGAFLLAGSELIKLIGPGKKH
jgi:rhamnogalacturonyl hydrolase YesR